MTWSMVRVVSAMRVVSVARAGRCVSLRSVHVSEAGEWHGGRGLVARARVALSHEVRRSRWARADQEPPEAVQQALELEDVIDSEIRVVCRMVIGSA